MNMTNPTPEPYAVTPWRASSTECEFCSEGSEYDTHRHEQFVSREGASTRTADELSAVFVIDAAALGAPVDADDLAFAESVNGWLDNIDDTDRLNDLRDHTESLLPDGLGVEWEDGYIIERINEPEYTWSTTSAQWQVDHGESGTARTISARAFLDHTHTWGPIEHARLTGNPHRKCTIDGCDIVTLDLHDEDEDEDDTDTDNDNEGTTR